MSETPHDKLQPDHPPLRPGLASVASGPWAGWYHWEPVDSFEGAAEPGRMLTARGEVVYAGGSLVFVRGIISAEDRAVLSFSGTIKRLRRAG